MGSEWPNDLLGLGVSSSPGETLLLRGSVLPRFWEGKGKYLWSVSMLGRVIDFRVLGLRYV